jgi:putative PIN family toxin of toxin-antitoxin system
VIIVLDTNVVVSGILRPFGKPAMILRLVAAGRIRCAYDLRLLTEYRNVLDRPKFGFSKTQVNTFLAQMEEEGLLVAAGPLSTRLPDPNDEPFLEVALAARAEVLVTGNKRHFPRGEYGGVKIDSPGEFLEQRGPKIGPA